MGTIADQRVGRRAQPPITPVPALSRISRVRIGRPALLWWGWAAALFLLYATVSGRRQALVRTTGYDLGIFEQAVRAYAHLHAPVSALRGDGFNLLGDHFHPVLAALAPSTASSPPRTRCSSRRPRCSRSPWCRSPGRLRGCSAAGPPTSSPSRTG